MKKQILLWAITAGIFIAIISTTIYYREKTRQEEEAREKFESTIAFFKKGIREVDTAQYLSEIDGFESAEVKVDVYLEKTGSRGQSLEWIENGTMTIHLKDGAFDGLSGKEILDMLHSIENEARSALPKIKETEFPDYYEYEMLDEGAFEGYEEYIFHWPTWEYYTETDGNVYKSEGLHSFLINGTAYVVSKYHGNNSASSDGGTSNRSSERSSRKFSSSSDSPEVYEDDYGVNDYDDPEDFYEAFEDDFEDEEDAEDYYDEYHD